MTPTTTYDKAYLESLIQDEICEDANLEYKGANALGRDDSTKNEITKDISSFANAGGGRLIYGIAEHNEKERRHIPQKIEPVDATKISGEWLDQICGLVQPRIAGLRIFSIIVGPKPSDVCYVVEIPMGDTAHQARDRKYYRRRNFIAEPMEDYEIREAMNRKVHPRLDASMSLSEGQAFDGLQMAVRLRNLGNAVAQHFAIRVEIPMVIKGIQVRPSVPDVLLQRQEHNSWWECRFSNLDNSPLFVDDSRIFPIRLDRIDRLSPPPTASTNAIGITAYADSAFPIRVTKDIESVWKMWG